MGNQQYYGYPAHPYANYLGANVDQYDENENDEEHDHMQDLLQALHPQQRQNLTIADLQRLQRIAQLKREQEERQAEKIRIAKQRKLQLLREQQLRKQQEEQAAKEAAAAAQQQSPQFVLVRDPESDQVQLVQVTPRRAPPAAANKQQPKKFTPYMQDRQFAHKWINDMAVFAQQYPQYIPLLKKAIEEQEKSNLERSSTPISSTPSPWSVPPQQAFQFVPQQQAHQAQHQQQKQHEEISDEEKKFLNHFAALMGGLHTPTTPKKQKQQLFDQQPNQHHHHVNKKKLQQQQLLSQRRSKLTEREEIARALEQYTPEELQHIRKLQLVRQEQERKAAVAHAYAAEQERIAQLKLQQQQQEKLKKQQEEAAAQSRRREEPMYIFVPPRGNEPGRLVLNPNVIKKLQQEQLLKQKEAIEKQKQHEEEEEEHAKLAKRNKAHQEHQEFIKSVPLQELFEHLEKQYQRGSKGNEEEEEDASSIEDDDILEDTLEELDEKWDKKTKKQIPIVDEKQEEVKPHVTVGAEQAAAAAAEEEEEKAKVSPKPEKLNLSGFDPKSFEHEAKIVKVEEKVNELLKELMEVGAIVSSDTADANILPRLHRLDEALSVQLLSLDTIVSDNEEIRKRRKQNVVRIQNLIAIVEGYVQRVTNPQEAAKEAAAVQAQHEEVDNVVVADEEESKKESPETPVVVEQDKEAPTVAPEVEPQETVAPVVEEQATPVVETPAVETPKQEDLEAATPEANAQ